MNNFIQPNSVSVKKLIQLNFPENENLSGEIGDGMKRH